MELEQRYIVLKKTDLATIPDQVLQETLFPVCKEVEAYRKQKGKAPLECLVIEKDWPEYPLALEMLSCRVDNVQALFGQVPRDMVEHVLANPNKPFGYHIGLHAENGVLVMDYDGLADKQALGDLSAQYEELRGIIDGGSESMTHEDAVEWCKQAAKNREVSYIADRVAKHSHYKKDVRHLDFIDVYRVLELFGVTNPAIQHAVKKLLVPGKRGAGKTLEQDIREAIDSLNRGLQMMAEDDGKLP